MALSKLFKLRPRDVYIYFGSFLVLLLTVAADPDSGLIMKLPLGAGAVATLLILLKSVLYVALLHFSRKAIMDYLDLESAIDKASQSSEGSGMVVVAVGLFSISIAIVIYAATH